MKKIFCIFAVVLILIMATVPCFAQSRFYNQLLNSVTYEDIPFSSNGWFYNGPNKLVYLDHVYYFINYYLPDPLISIRNPYGGASFSNRFKGSDVRLGPGNVLYFYYYTDPSNVSFVNQQRSFTYRIMLVDATLIYGSGNEPSFEQFLLDFPIFNDYVSRTSQSLYYDGSFNNVLTFFSHLPESFTHFANIYEFTDIYIFLAGVFAILFVIFLVFMVIRRCRNL